MSFFSFYTCSINKIQLFVALSFILSLTPCSPSSPSPQPNAEDAEPRTGQTSSHHFLFILDCTQPSSRDSHESVATHFHCETHFCRHEQDEELQGQDCFMIMMTSQTVFKIQLNFSFFTEATEQHADR